MMVEEDAMSEDEVGSEDAETLQHGGSRLAGSAQQFLMLGHGLGGMDGDAHSTPARLGGGFLDQLFRTGFDLGWSDDPVDAAAGMGARPVHEGQRLGIPLPAPRLVPVEVEAVAA